VDAEFLANALDDPDHAGQSLNGPHDER